MSLVAISGNASGTGTLTIAAPNTNSNYTLTLPTNTGTLLSTKSAGTVLQVATFQTGAVATGTGTIPIDDTIPQITEGTEFMTLAITPTSAANKLIINVTMQLDKNNANTLTVALFQDSTANAIASQFYGALGSGISMPMSFTHSMISGTTSATTFRVRAGSDAAGTVTINGRGGGRIDGGVAVSSITIYEVAV
jgi:hypothetical protein